MYTPRLPQIFEDSFKRYPNHVALNYNNVSITYEQLAENVAAWVNELVSVGIAPGMKVLLAVNEPIEFITVWVALWRLNCIPIPLEGTINEIELNRAIQASECNYVVASSNVDIDATSGADVRNSQIQPLWWYIRLSRQPAKEHAGDIAVFFYTSGTTGLPKCVEFDHAAMAANVVSLARAINLNEEDVFFTPQAPMLPATLATAVLPALASGAALVITKTSIPGNILKNISAKNVTVFFAVPYIYDLLTNTMEIRGNEAWKGVRLCLTSSAFLEPHLFDRFYNMTHLPIHSIYCSSEAGAITYNGCNDIQLVRNSVGLPLPNVEIKIVNEKGEDLSGRESGEILVRGNHLSKGYYKQPGLQQEVFKDGWVKTGDSGYIDSSGYLMLNGRISDTINVSGFLVNPVEIEQVIISHDEVAEVLVYGRNDSRFGEIIAAKIVTKEGKDSLDIDSLLDFCSKRLMHYKVPRHIEFVKEIPKSRYGKKVRLKSEVTKGG